MIVMFVGTDGATAGEGNDRNSLAMPGNYDSLINQTAALGNPKMAVVIQSDGPVKIDDELSKVAGRACSAGTTARVRVRRWPTC